jgi:hypothetical protein
MVLGICETPQEVRTAAQTIGGIVQSMKSDDAYLQLMETSFKAAAEATAKLPDNRRPLNTAHLLKAEIG